MPKTKLAIQQAIQGFRVVIVSTPWFHSWFTPVGANATLPAADYQVGGHAIAAIGWTPTRLVGLGRHAESRISFGRHARSIHRARDTMSASCGHLDIRHTMGKWRRALG